MKYRKFGNTGFEVSALGFGSMRMPLVEGAKDDSEIDVDLAIEMIRTGIDGGINYVDTAWAYHGGESEIVVGSALGGGYREKVKLATKSTLWLIEKEGDFDRILDKQLEKLKTDHVDMYLLHAVNNDSFKNKVLGFGLLTKMEKAKSDGRIRHIGFSFHDGYDAFRNILDTYDGFEFCQIQMNYIDVEHQATLKGLKYAAEKGLAVVIMEPILGGKLARLPENLSEKLPEGKNAVEAALDFLWDMPEVSVVLSGMSTLDHVKENLEYASSSGIGKLTEKDFKAYSLIREEYNSLTLIPCTACEYCMPCPMGIEIPRMMETYNSSILKGYGVAANAYENFTVGADKCIACRQCEKICPQGIIVSDWMKKIVSKFS
ncbi:MAG: aldo/keto reductase [Ruminococcaceae bacterium]|nr:aldo/keto reductase [Oscillospiraceae bacterium]